MADFKLANEKTKEHEGGYSNHPNDKGGETYKGIARNFWKDWEGWKIVDTYTDKNQLKNDTKLNELVDEFYKKNFWDKFYLSDINSQYIAEILYDIKVNGGNPWLWLQQTINVLNKEQKLWEDVTADGVIGKKTIELLNKACNTKNSYGVYTYEALIIDMLLSLRDNYFVDVSMKRETNEAFTAGWKIRVMKQRLEYYKKLKIQ